MSNQFDLSKINPTIVDLQEAVPLLPRRMCRLVAYLAILPLIVLVLPLAIFLGWKASLIGVVIWVILNTAYWRWIFWPVWRAAGQGIAMKRVLAYTGGTDEMEPEDR